MKNYDNATKQEKIFSIILGMLFIWFLAGIGYLAIMASGNN